MSLVIEEWIPVREKVGNSRQRSKKDFSSQGRVVTIGSVSIVCVCVWGEWWRLFSLEQEIYFVGKVLFMLWRSHHESENK